MASRSRAAFVTGGGKNIGRAICNELAARGYDVAINGLSDRAACERVAEEVRKAGRRAMVVMGDAGDSKARGEMAKAALAEFGAISAFVANAAIRPHKSFLDVTEEHWREVMALDLESGMFLSKAFLPGMIAQKWGRIVLITGRHAIRGSSGPARNRDDGRATVAIAKHGLWGLAKSLANEFGHAGITANAVSPGFIDKENDPAWTARGEIAKAEIPVGRIGQPQDISATCGFLCSEEASFVTGQMIGVNGGVEY